MSTASAPTDSFARVSAALRAVWPTVADQASGPSRAELGRMLDECGSDHRPLLELLLDVGRVIRPALQDVPPQANATWPQRRAPLVHKLVATRYLQADVARWATDVWGVVLGVAPALVAAPPTVQQAVDTLAPEPVAPVALSAAASARGSRAAAPPTVTPTRPATVLPSQVPAALRQVPSWAGGPVSFGTGQRPKASTLTALAQHGRVVVQGPVVAGPKFQPAERRAAMVLGALLVAISVGLLNAFSGRPSVTTPVDAQPLAIGADAATATMTTDTRRADATAGETGTAEAPATDAPAADAQTTGATTVESPMVDAPMPEAPVAAGMRPLPESAALRDGGVGGRYLVAQRVRDVSGSESCDAVAGALAGGRETEEIIAHRPGDATFTMVTRGVRGTLDTDGEFVSQMRVGTTNNVNWQFRMRGRFTREGFVGESVTHTDAILRWGKTQTCVVTADLSARRLLP